MLVNNAVRPCRPSTSPVSDGGLSEHVSWIPLDISRYDSSSLYGAAYILANELATTGILSDRGGQHEDYFEEVLYGAQKYGDRGPWEYHRYTVLKLPKIELVKIIPDTMPGEPTPLLHLAAFFVDQALENGESQFEGTEVELANRIRHAYPAQRIALDTVVGVGI